MVAREKRLSEEAITICSDLAGFMSMREVYGGQERWRKVNIFLGLENVTPRIHMAKSIPFVDVYHPAKVVP